jgi:hypothetical protein
VIPQEIPRHIQKWNRRLHIYIFNVFPRKRHGDLLIESLKEPVFLDGLLCVLGHVPYVSREYRHGSHWNTQGLIGKSDGLNVSLLFNCRVHDWAFLLFPFDTCYRIGWIRRYGELLRYISKGTINEGFGDCLILELGAVLALGNTGDW